jgi:hypothetical protein
VSGHADTNRALDAAASHCSFEVRLSGKQFTNRCVDRSWDYRPGRLTWLFWDSATDSVSLARFVPPLRAQRLSGYLPDSLRQKEQRAESRWSVAADEERQQ